MYIDTPATERRASPAAGSSEPAQGERGRFDFVAGDQQVRAAYNDAAYKNYLNERKIELDCLQQDAKLARRALPESAFERSETVVRKLKGASQYPHTRSPQARTVEVEDVTREQLRAGVEARS